jgi:hypothetical protein
VSYVLEEIRKHPVDVPSAPPYPDKSLQIPAGTR